MIVNTCIFYRSLTNKGLAPQIIRGVSTPNNKGLYNCDYDATYLLLAKKLGCPLAGDLAD